MYILSGKFLFAVTLGHTEKFPAVALIEAAVVSEQIERVNYKLMHIPTNKIQHFSSYAPAAVFFLRIHGTDIWGKILSVMEIVFDETKTADYFIFVENAVPLGHGARAAQALVYAFKVSLLGYAPLAIEPCGHLCFKFRLLA